MEVDDLLLPIGPLDPSFFPGYTTDSLSSLLQGFLDDASARAAGLPADSQPDATRAWAQWRAFDMIANRLSATPASATIEGEGSRSYTAGQANLMRRRADSELATFRQFVTDAANAATGASSASEQTAGAVRIHFYP